MNDPLVYSKLDADRILRRAAEIEGSEDGRRVTESELRSIAGEAGFSAQALDRAIAEAHEAGALGVLRPPVQKWGLVITRLSVIREIPVELSSDQLMRLVRLVHPYREGSAQVKLEENEITWRDRKGLRFSITSYGGVTEVRVHVAKLLIRKGRWMGWVKAAADRLEALAFLVADRKAPRAAAPPPALTP